MGVSVTDVVGGEGDGRNGSRSDGLRANVARSDRISVRVNKGAGGVDMMM